MKAELQQEVVTKKPKKTGKSKSSNDVLPQPNTITTTTIIPERHKKYQSEYIAIVLGIMLEIQALTIDVIADQPQGSMYVCMYCMYVCMYVRMYVCIYCMYVCVCMYVRMYVYLK